MTSTDQRLSLDKIAFYSVDMAATLFKEQRGIATGLKETLTTEQGKQFDKFGTKITSEHQTAKNKPKQTGQAGKVVMGDASREKEEACDIHHHAQSV
eukprot:1129350-Ditylum_brightwellii.AAC.1